MSNATNKGDDEYRRATKEVVDDTMRIDVLGPYVVKVLKEHSPTSDQVKVMLVTAITNDASVQSTLEKFIDDHKIKNRGKGLTQMQTAFVTGIVTLLLSVVTAVLLYFILPPRK